MTHEEFKWKLSGLERQYNRILEEVENARREFSESYPLHKGDACIDPSGRKCYFGRISFFGLFGGGYSTYVNYKNNKGLLSKKENRFLTDKPLKRCEE